MIYAAKLDYRCATILRSKSKIKVTHFAGQVVIYYKKRYSGESADSKSFYKYRVGGQKEDNFEKINKTNN